MMIIKLAILEFALFTCIGFMFIREHKRREAQRKMMEHWLNNNVGKCNIKLRVIR